MSTITSTITAKLEISGPGTTTQTLDISNVIMLPITNPSVTGAIITVPTSLITIQTTPAGGGYLYVKNIENSVNSSIEVYYGSTVIGILQPDQFAFLPTPTNGVYFKLKGSVETTAEYSLWTKSQGSIVCCNETTYTHTQGAALSVWTITHNLDRFPSVTTIDSIGNVIIGDVYYVSPNELTITFVTGEVLNPTSGVAYLN